MYKEPINLDQLKKVIEKVSINNLLHILIYHGIDVKDIKLIPILKNSVLDSTILGISSNRKKIYIKINVFKINIFSPLESKYQQYIKNGNTHAINILEYGIQTLLYRYVFGTKSLHYLLQQNVYKKIPPLSTVNGIIDSLYKLLAEDFCTIINYEKKFINIKREVATVGSDNIGSIFLGGFIPSFVYLIKVNIIFLNQNSKNKNISNLETTIKNFHKNIKNDFIDIILVSSVEMPKEDIIYIGDYSLKN